MFQGTCGEQECSREECGGRLLIKRPIPRPPLIMGMEGRGYCVIHWRKKYFQNTPGGKSFELE